MADKAAFCRGSLLALAAGDAMGRPVDTLSLNEIFENYGPNGLLGYDLTGGNAEVTAYTQVAAFVGNGLLLGMSRGKTDYLPFIVLSLREWAGIQQLRRDPGKCLCWVAGDPSLRIRNCRDARMPDVFRLGSLGTPTAPVSRNTAAGALPAAVAIGLFYDPRRMDKRQLASLAVQTVALTHGDPETFLSGAVLALAVADMAQDSRKSMLAVFSSAIETVCTFYKEEFPQPIETLTARLQESLALAQQRAFPVKEDMEQLGCKTAAACLAGAMYACLTADGDFDTALITAVNHSGMSAAVGALTGGLMGAYLGADALPEFYLESLCPVSVLSELAADLASGGVTTGLFDGRWDHKYMQDLPRGWQQNWDVNL